MGGSQSYFGSRLWDVFFTRRDFVFLTNVEKPYFIGFVAIETIAIFTKQLSTALQFTMLLFL